MHVATCIGCGCNDYNACESHDGPCSWIEVDYQTERGVCSCCPDQLTRWRAGERAISMLVAKIIKDGETDPYYIERNDIVSFPHLLDVQPGDKFSVEWVKMTRDEFEALPQFEHLRLARQWLAECEAANAAEARGLQDDARTHLAEADRIEALVTAAGHELECLVELM